MYLRGTDEPRDYVQALKWFEKSGNQGNTDAAYNAGNVRQWHQRGARLCKRQWYLKRLTATRARSEAQAALGTMYFNGQGVPQDYARRSSGYQKAADQDDTSLPKQLGAMYAKGQGVTQDFEKVFVLLKKSRGRRGCRGHGPTSFSIR